MGEFLTFRNYLIGAVIAAIIVLLIVQFGGPSLIAWIESLKGDAAFVGISSGLIDLITAPLLAGLRANPILIGIVAGIFWPLVILWIFFLFALMVLTLLSGGLGSARSTIPGN